MMIKLLQVLFVPKSARAKLAARSGKPAAVSRRGPGPKTSDAAAPSRDRLLTDTMALYRQQRADVYDSLDEETRRQIEADAEKAFGTALRAKR